jgi:hypothetical protein
MIAGVINIYADNTVCTCIILQYGPHTIERGMCSNSYPISLRRRQRGIAVCLYWLLRHTSMYFKAQYSVDEIASNKKCFSILFGEWRWIK